MQLKLTPSHQWNGHCTQKTLARYYRVCEPRRLSTAEKVNTDKQENNAIQSCKTTTNPRPKMTKGTPADIAFVQAQILTQ